LCVDRIFRLAQDEAKRKAADIAAVLEGAGPMSARELNRAKRKAKQLAKSKEEERRLRVSSGGITPDTAKGKK
jgi:hypothetical protein